VRSYLLRNDKGKFTDVTHEVVPELEHPGLVTAALWTDFNNDGRPDLVVTGEWMPVLFFENRYGKLVNLFVGSGLEYNDGWFNSIVGADFDHDGDIDYVVGNYGLNSKIKASREKPASIVYKDFDGNGTNDAILCYYQNDGKSYPWCSRDDFTDQMRVMKKKLLRYADYADKTINEIFTPDELRDANWLYAYNFESSYIQNLGNGHFKISPLPLPAQCSPVYGMTTGDYNEDGNMDVLLTGNFFSENINIGRNDAGNGLLLLGNGNGEFDPVHLKESGFFTPMDAKGMATVYDVAEKKMIVLVANNDSSMQSFRWNQSANSVVVKTEREDVRITWEDRTGKKNLQEVYYGSGYLSQASQTFVFPPGSTHIIITNSKGQKREVSVVKLK
jgi:hypothetical protein